VKVEDGEGAGQLGRVAREVQQLGAGALARVVAACLARPPPQPTDKLLTNLCAFVCSNPGRCPPVTLSQLTGEESEQVQSERGILSLIYSERGADWEGEAGVGAALVLTCLAREHGPELPSQLARLWELATQLEGEPQQAVGSLAVLAVLCPALHPVLHPRLTALLPLILGLACHGLTAVRYGAGAGLAVLAATLPGQVLEGVVDTLLPALQPARPLPCRQGAVEAVHLLADRLQLDIVPYIVLLLVPVLGAMSDPDRQVRLLATNTFAGLVRLLPLDGAGAGELPPALQNKKAAESMFLAQLLEPGRAAPHPLAVPVQATLRSYQQAGLNWLAFLNRYRLHGILCDEMGLGKTLQTICMLASDHSAGSKVGASLVVCPATLGGHWQEEVSRFVSSDHLQPFLYMGPPTARQGLRARLSCHNLVITSYDIVRNDIEYLGGVQWNYLVLDEGHVIKNTRTKTAIAIRQLEAAHRLILTGTPIQNGVTELWALFDFLMPGYLGTEKQFTARYTRPILASRQEPSRVLC